MGDSSVTPPASRFTIIALWGLCLLGLGLRGWLAERLYPMTAGDPLYSYTYRAVLIAEGRWEGVKLMWHPPGYPLLVGGLTALTGGLAHPYAVGVGVSLGCYVGLFWVVDRLVKSRTNRSLTRLVAGSFVAFYETLALWSTSPLTEPVYLLLLYAAVLTIDRPRTAAWQWLVAGLLLGVAFTTRLEAAAPTAGLGLYALARGWAAGGWRGASTAAVAFSVGWLATAGWLLADFSYVRQMMLAQQESYTFPPGGGVGRLLACVYHGVTVWLPFALLLPYWALLGVGLIHPARAGDRPAGHALLLAVVVPSVAAVAWTIMHKRTASFLFPAAAVWVALGTEEVARRWGAARPAVGRWVFAAVILLNVVQAGRIAVFLREEIPPREAADAVAATSLHEARCPPGSVWAFGSEPDIYALCRWPVVYPFFDRDAGYNAVYEAAAGKPDEFVEELRRRGFAYLAFVLAETAQPDGAEPQPFSCFGPRVRRSDLVDLTDDPRRYGLRLIKVAPADRGRVRSYVFAIDRPGAPD